MITVFIMYSNVNGADRNLQKLLVLQVKLFGIALDQSLLILIILKYNMNSQRVCQCIRFD